MIKEEAIEILSDMRAEYNIFSDDEEEATRYHALSWAIQALNEQLRTGRKKGKWIKADTHNYLFFKNDRVYKCSCCRQLLDFEGVNGGRGDANFCPHCGARMEEQERAF